MLEHLPEKQFTPHIWVFLCDCCLDKSGIEKSRLIADHGTNILHISELCLSLASPKAVRKAFEKGADGVMLCGCQLGNCRLGNNVERLNLIHQHQKLLRVMGVEPKRLGLEFISPGGPKTLRECVGDFIARVGQMGPVMASALGENQAEG